MSGAKIGVISGSGSYDLDGMSNRRPHEIATAYGIVPVTLSRLGGADVVHISRHGQGHQRLSNQVDHRANLAALIECGVEAIVSLTACGAVNPQLAPGSLVVFDDLYFPSNRLPDGSLCTWHTEPGATSRGHWIFDGPFSAPLRDTLLAAAGETDAQFVDGGCYGHVDGPRFNTRTEVAALARLGVTAISQTAGPEAVLAGEAEIPFALVGFVTDYANGVAVVPEPLDALAARMKQSTDVFAALLDAALSRIRRVPASGFVYRFDS